MGARELIKAADALLGGTGGQPNNQPQNNPQNKQPNNNTNCQLIFHDKVTPDFQAKVKTICKEVGIPDPNFLMACMAFETGKQFKSSTKNKVSGATGLIQFMPRTAKSLGTTTDALSKMTEVQQLDYVKKYFQAPHLKGKLNQLSDLYMAILWPVAAGKAENTPLFKQPTIQYTQNKGLDSNNDGV